MSITAALFKPTKTEEILISMLKENVGDGNIISQWVSNQTRQFMIEPRATVNFHNRKINYSRSLFHHLNDHLDIHEKLSAEFHQFASQDQFKDRPWLSIMGEFIDHQSATRDVFKLWLEYHTQNDKNTLDQNIQYLFFDYKGDPFVLLSIHNGDVIKSGYSTPWIFSVLQECFFHFGDGCIKCDSCRTYWYTGDSCHWYFEATHGILEKVQLEDLVDDLEVDDDGNATCPKCQSGRLTT
jgi:hypothetical protein